MSVTFINKSKNCRISVLVSKPKMVLQNPVISILTLIFDPISVSQSQTTCLFHTTCRILKCLICHICMIAILCAWFAFNKYKGTSCQAGLINGFIYCSTAREQHVCYAGVISNYGAANASRICQKCAKGVLYYIATIIIYGKMPQPTTNYFLIHLRPRVHGKAPFYALFLV